MKHFPKEFFPLTPTDKDTSRRNYSSKSPRWDNCRKCKIFKVSSRSQSS